MTLRPLRDRLLLQVLQTAEITHMDDGRPVAVQSGLLLPVSATEHSTSHLGRVLAVGPTGDQDLLGRTVLFNPWQAVELDDALVMCAPRTVVAVAADPWAMSPGWVAIEPLPGTGPQSPGGILLTEVYQDFINKGHHPDTGETLQVGVGRVALVGPMTTVCQELQPGDWVLFEYRRVLWFEQYVLVRVEQPVCPLYAVMPEAMARDFA